MSRYTGSAPSAARHRRAHELPGVDRLFALRGDALSGGLAVREDGAWRVVEVGDGQVSGLPWGTDPRPPVEAPAAAHDSGRSRPSNR